MQPKNMFLAFLQELLQRFFTRSPKFFRIFQALFGIATAITGIPEFLIQYDIHLPAVFGHKVDKFVAAVSLGITIASALTTQSTPVAQPNSNTPPLKQTDPGKLPFTAANETKAGVK